MPEEQRRSRRGGLAHSVRTAAIWEAVLQAAHARQEELGRGLRVLDLGGGTGGTAVPLAVQGYDVTVVDPSPDALASLDRRAREEGVQERVHGVQGDAGTLGDLGLGDGVDLLTCHGVLEVVDDPAASVRDLAAVLAPGGLLSLLVAQRLAAVLARALAGQFAAAQHALHSPDGTWGEGDPVPRRFDADQVRGFVTGAGLEVLAAHGMRVFGDLVPATFLDTESDRTALLDLERALAEHPSYVALGHLGSALHVLARRG